MAAQLTDYGIMVQVNGVSYGTGQFNIEGAKEVLVQQGLSPAQADAALKGLSAPATQQEAFDQFNAKYPDPGTQDDPVAVVLENYRGGLYGPVGSDQAIRAATQALAQAYKEMGNDATTAMQKATTALSGKLGGTTGLGAPTPSPSGDTSQPPGPTGDTSRYGRNTFGLPLPPLSQQQEGRRELPLGNLFAAFLNEQSPLGRGSGPGRSYLASQEGALSDLYRLGQAAQDIPDITSFKDYLGQRGGISRPGVGEFTNYARRGAEALTGAASDLTNPFREYLSAAEDTPGSRAAAQERQYDLGFAGSYPNLAREFRGVAGRGAHRAFEQFRYDNPTSDFLPWLVNRGFKFFN